MRKEEGRPPPSCAFPAAKQAGVGFPAAAMASSSGTNVAAARSELRKLTEQVVNNKAEATSTRSNYLGKALDKSNSLYETLKHDARGAAIDASFLSTTSALGAEQAGNLEQHTPEKYIGKLRARFGFQSSTKIKWHELATAIVEAGIFAPAPAATFIDGRFEAPEKKARQKREKRSRDEPEGPAQVAESVDVQKLQEVEENKAQVVRMNVLAKTIKEAAAANEANGGLKRASFFQVLLHPTSFSQTVENFFDLAFLIKDGKAKITSDADGLYLNQSKPAVTDDFNAGVSRVQNILKLDYATYQQLVARWCTPEAPPLLPDRGERTAGEGSRSGTQPRTVE